MAIALVSFAAKSGATVVAEGIETEAELAMLISLGVTTGQGFFMGRPAAAAAWREQHSSLAFDEKMASA
jgi:EAL domain-containing protein (putative c-di-GMP-specific phosphodiesterase class I)